MALCLLNFPNKFATSIIIKYLELKRKLHFKNHYLSWKTGFKLFSRKARHYESGSMCNVLISLIRQHNGPLLFLHATLLCSLSKFSDKFSFSCHILHLYWPWALSKHHVREMLKCFTKSVQSHLQPSSKHVVIPLSIRNIIQ